MKDLFAVPLFILALAVTSCLWIADVLSGAVYLRMVAILALSLIGYYVLLVLVEAMRFHRIRKRIQKQVEKARADGTRFQFVIADGLIREGDLCKIDPVTRRVSAYRPPIEPVGGVQ